MTLVYRPFQILVGVNFRTRLRRASNRAPQLSISAGRPDISYRTGLSTKSLHLVYLSALRIFWFLILCRFHRIVLSRVSELPQRMPVYLPYSYRRSSQIAHELVYPCPPETDCKIVRMVSYSGALTENVMMIKKNYSYLDTL